MRYRRINRSQQEINQLRQVKSDLKRVLRHRIDEIETNNERAIFCVLNAIRSGCIEGSFTQKGISEFAREIARRIIDRRPFAEEQETGQQRFAHMMEWSISLCSAISLVPRHERKELTRKMKEFVDLETPGRVEALSELFEGIGILEPIERDYLVALAFRTFEKNINFEQMADQIERYKLQCTALKAAEMVTNALFGDSEGHCNVFVRIFIASAVNTPEICASIERQISEEAVLAAFRQGALPRDFAALYEAASEIFGVAVNTGFFEWLAERHSREITREVVGEFLVRETTSLAIVVEKDELKRERSEEPKKHIKTAVKPIYSNIVEMREALRELFKLNRNAAQTVAEVFFYLNIRTQQQLEEFGEQYIGFGRAAPSEFANEKRETVEGRFSTNNFLQNLIFELMDMNIEVNDGNRDRIVRCFKEGARESSVRGDERESWEHVMDKLRAEIENRANCKAND